VTGHVTYRGVVPTGEIIDRSHLDSMTIWIGPDLHLVQYRLRGGAVMNNVATVSSRRFRRGDKDFGGWDELEEVFSRADPRVRDMLRYFGRDRNWVLHDRDPMTHWTRGRATLLGMPRIRRCSTWRKERTWRSRTAWCWPKRSLRPGTITAAPFLPTSAAA